jgi:hypothetical protein
MVMCMPCTSTVKHPRIECGGLSTDRTSQRKTLKGNCETSLSKLWQQGI